jgi:hypothetical protein
VEAHERVIEISGVTSELSRCHHEILNLVGCGRELSEVQRVADEIEEVRKGLDYLLCEGMVAADDLLARYEAGELDFQR